MTLSGNFNEKYGFLVDSKLELDRWESHYLTAKENSFPSQIVELVEIYFQLHIFVVDMLETSFLLQTNNPESFSNKSTLRLGILRALEITYVTGQLYKKLLNIAKAVECSSKGDIYISAAKKFKEDRKKLEAMSGIRHTAGHYFSDSREFIHSIRSMDVGMSAVLIESAMNYVGALHRYAGEILSKIEDDVAQLNQSG